MLNLNLQSLFIIAANTAAVLFLGAVVLAFVCAGINLVARRFTTDNRAYSLSEGWNRIAQALLSLSVVLAIIAASMSALLNADMLKLEYIEYTDIALGGSIIMAYLFVGIFLEHFSQKRYEEDRAFAERFAAFMEARKTNPNLLFRDFR